MVKPADSNTTGPQNKFGILSNLHEYCNGTVTIYQENMLIRMGENKKTNAKETFSPSIMRWTLKKQI